MLFGTDFADEMAGYGLDDTRRTNGICDFLQKKFVMVKSRRITNMKTPFSKEDIKKLCDVSYKIMETSSGEILGDIKEDEREIVNNDFEENIVLFGNCFDGFFEQINVCRFGEKLFVELQKLGDPDGYYKDWAMKKYMKTLAEICDNMDDILVSNYEYIEDDPMFRAFFVAFVFDINEYKFYEEVYKYCHDFCDQLEILVERKTNGHFWDEKFETDEKLFCAMYLTPFFHCRQ